MTEKKFYIDVTPEWSGLVPWFCAVLESDSATRTAKDHIRSELMRLARFADERIKKAKND